MMIENFFKSSANMRIQHIIFSLWCPKIYYFCKSDPEWFSQMSAVKKFQKQLAWT